MKAIADLTSRLQDHLGSGNPVWFFLDYDGTLADFAPTTDVEPGSHFGPAGSYLRGRDLWGGGAASGG
jgi:hypothetical protein